jgi:dUTP pyrophosphatase
MKIKRLNENAVLPVYAKPGDAGFDLVATEDVIIEPGETKLVPTGLAFELPEGFELQVRPRSGVTLKTKLRVQLGTVDAGYRGEVGVIVDNNALPSLYFNEEYRTIATEFRHKPKTISGTWDEPYDFEQEFTYIIRKGDRIAQGVLAPVAHAQFEEVSELSGSQRGAGGFGSTGVKHEEAE